jgi:hypothetical protein
MNAMARRAAAKGSARGKKGKKKPARSGDPRRAAEVTPGGGQQGPASQPPALGGAGGPGAGGLSGLPQGFPEDLAEGLANLQPGLNFPPPSPGNIPAAFRGGNKRDKKK